MNKRAVLATVIALAMIGVYVHAQFGDKPAQLSTVKIKDDLFVIHNDFVPGNTTALVTNEGVLLVDDKFEIDFPNIVAEVKKLTNQPIKYVINTHHHADHAGGMRAYVAEGIPIITHESHRKYYEEQIFKNPHSLNPDRLARMPRAPMLEFVKDKRVLSDSSQALEIYLMKDQPHSEGLLMVYLPKSKLLIQADAYVPRPGAPPLSAPSPYTTNLVDNASRLKLDVERVVQIHGGVVPYSEVLAAAGRRVSTN